MGRRLVVFLLGVIVLDFKSRVLRGGFIPKSEISQ